MDELYNILDILFRKIPINYIIEGQVSFKSIPSELIERLCYTYEKSSDESEIHKRFFELENQIQFQMHEDMNDMEMAGRYNVFYLIDMFIRKVLEEKQGNVICKFKYLQEWREVTNRVENTVFLAAMYAKIDHRNGKVRNTFIWSDIIGHDNILLNRILAEGISDNHFHLMGSVHHFSLSWLVLMNHVHQPEFIRSMNEMDRQKRNPRIRISQDYKEEPYEVLHLQAALIRLYLFSEIAGYYIEVGRYYASWEMVVSHIIKKCGSVHGFIDSLRDTLEGSFLRSSELMELYLSRYPEYCWLFKRILGVNLYEISEEKLDEIENQDNVAMYLIQLAEETGKILLEDCDWIFADEQSLYETEWRRQTRENVWKLLKDSRLLLEFRVPMQWIIDGLIEQMSGISRDYASISAGAWYDTVEIQGLIQGERWLEYMIFRNWYARTDSLTEDHYNLFYMYLLIKESFRMELLQTNEKLGFINFHKYQKRKGLFTSYYTYGELARAAIEASVQNQNIESLEIRIGFGETCAEDAEIVRYYDNEIRKSQLKGFSDKYYYVMGFGKRADNFRKSPDECGYMFYRHYDLRRRIRREASALIELRKKNPELAKRIRGVDAFSHEDGCRPEVFATVYRVLKRHSCYRGLSIKPELPQLRMTYHVGETFTDILDGLRAIDEAVHFLNLDCGDRLGHATVLGMDVEKWYKDCNYKFLIRRQDYLDNIVWLYQKLLQYHISDTDTLMQYLENQFEKYFALTYRKFMGELYIENVACDACAYDSDYSARYRIQSRIHHSYDYRYGSVRDKDGAIYDFNIRNYYYSWMLRGDHPGLYENGFYGQHFNIESIWDECSVNREFPKDQRIRYILPAAILNHFYHYNSYVRESGEETETVTVPVNMVRAIQQVQKAMQFELAQREIAIETNPSSNLMINRIASYDQHPIFKLYNIGLIHDPDILEECPQMNVSVNTDDQGGFSTCLSNEFALIASSLSRLRDSDGKHVYKKADIYQWIKNVQEMGNNQSFLKAEADMESFSMRNERIEEVEENGTGYFRQANTKHR